MAFQHMDSGQEKEENVTVKNLQKKQESTKQLFKFKALSQNVQYENNLQKSINIKGVDDTISSKNS